MDEREPLLSDGTRVHYYFEDNGKNKIIDFDPNGDPENPMDWPARFRWTVVFLLAFMAMTVTFTCIGVVPLARDIVMELEGARNRSASVLFVTIWELGEAAGPLLIAPLSEVFGRYPVYNACNILFAAGVAMTALSQDVHVLIFARFLTGCAVASNVLNPAIIGDIFPRQTRGSGMSAIFLAPLVGGAIGPSVSGALGQAIGWRGVMWLAFGLAATTELTYLVLLRETYKVPILQRRAARIRKETGDDSYKSKFDLDVSYSLRSILRSMFRPVEVFFSSLVLQLLSLWGALVFSFFYVMSTTLPDMLEDIYGFDASLKGVSFLSFSVGSMLAVATCNGLVDRLFNKLQARHGEQSYPEGRLPLVIGAAFLLPITVVLYGAAPQFHWPVWVLLSIVVIQGYAIVIAVVPMMTYVTDGFGLFSASAITAVLITRCLAGTFLPLVTEPLTEKVGYGWGFAILAGGCLLLSPIPPLVMRYGPKWRQRSSYSRDKDAE